MSMKILSFDWHLLHIWMNCLSHACVFPPATQEILCPPVPSLSKRSCETSKIFWCSLSEVCPGPWRGGTQACLLEQISKCIQLCNTYLNMIVMMRCWFWCSFSHFGMWIFCGRDLFLTFVSKPASLSHVSSKALRAKLPHEPIEHILVSVTILISDVFGISTSIFRLPLIVCFLYLINSFQMRSDSSMYTMYNTLHTSKSP